jgi:hypothetical protein
VGTAEREAEAPRTAGEVRPARPAVGPRLAAHLSHEPVSWWERRCPSCNHSFKRNVAVCPVDATPLKRVEVSLPFLWIG